MNVCIITVYNTENCGSFWQAYALASAIEQMGHTVSFLYRDLKDTTQSLRGYLHVFCVKCAKLDFKAAHFVWKKAKIFKNAVKEFNVIYEGTTEFNDIDLFIIGSDTVWNFASPYFMRHHNKYTGSKFGAHRCITYAASAANTPSEMFEIPEIKEPIQNLKAISVRDEYTYDIVKKITGRSASIVCDPTMLVERSIFEQKAAEIVDEHYILLYHFANITDAVKKEILELKRKYGLKVISFGEHRSWCDKTVVYDPYMFVSYFKNAAFVITDTFHGTIFSILYERNFAEYGNSKKKIADLLKTLELTAAVKENNVALSDMFEKGLDYTQATEKIKTLRAESMLYLKENLSEK